MGIIARISLITFCIWILLAGVASAQRNIPPASQQDDNVDTPLLRQRARDYARERKAAGRGAPEKDDPRARLEWQRHDRGIPSVEFKEHVLKLQRARSAAQARAKATLATGVTTSNPVWVPIGPTGADYEQNGWFTGFVQDSGRARTILPHPTDANTVYFLTSGGGLWVTHNFTSTLATWIPLTDSLPTTGGGSVALGSTPGVIYLGLGDPFDLINTAGVMFKSIDGGTTWANSVDLLNAMSVRDVKVDTSGSQDIVLVATDFGLFRSIDGGISYAEVTGFGFQGQSAWSLVQTSAGWLLNAQPCGTLIPAVGCGTQATIYLSTDHGATWAPISNTGNVYTGTGRTTLGVGTPGDSIVYAFAENANSNPNLDDQGDLFRSTDGGQSWTALGLNSKVPTNSNPDNPNMDLMHGQAYYNQMILVDPRDATRNTVYLGGNLSSAKSTDGGNTWTLLSNWLGGGTINQSGFGFGFGLPYAHADFHAAALSTAGNPTTLMFGNDGGLFVSTDNGTTWSSDKNNGLQTFLFYSLTSTPTFPSGVIAAAQDDGTRVREGNSGIYNQSGGGDGFGTGWSQANSNVATSTVEFSQFFVNWTNQIPDSSNNFVRSSLINDGAFATPVEVPNGNLDPSGKVFFSSSLTRIDKTIDGANNFTIIGQVGFNGIPSTVTLRTNAHSVGVSPVDLLHVAVAATAGHIEITSNGGSSWTDRALNTLLPGFHSFVAGVTWADNNTLYVTSVAPSAGAVRVAKSTDGGASWARADNGLPDVPTPRVIIDKRDATNNTLLAASDLGIYRSSNGGGNWSPYDTGLPNVRVSDIYMPADGSFLRAATWGRGLWELPSLAFVNATLTDGGVSCDHDGVLDNGETGPLTITLHNDGITALSSIGATITSTNPNVTFPNGNAVNFPAAAAGGNATAAVTVALNGVVGIQQINFNVAFADPSLNLPLPVNALASFRANTDEIPNGSANDSVEANNSAWTIAGTSQSLPDLVSWQRRQITPVEHRWVEVDSNVPSDESLISPVMQVGTGTFTISFEQRYFFDWDFNNTWFDGMVFEMSTDGGTSWSDIGQFATPGYDHVLAAGGGNVLEGRMAYAGWQSVYPAFVPVTVNLGTQFAGKSVQMRFRVGTDVIGATPGVEIRNITTSGLTNTPFTALVADTGHCSISPTTTALTSSKNPSNFGDSVTFGATVTGGSSTATGKVAFKDGTATIGTGTLNGSGQTSFATSKLNAGLRNITGVYSGDATHLASTSSVLVQTVNGVPTTTALVSNLNPSTFGQSVTFTATVSSSNGTPTGKVTFKNGTKTLGTVSLLSGAASFSTSTLSAGTLTITAAYGGSTKFATSMGSVTQMVNKAGTTTTITGSSPPSPSTFGQSVTFTATVATSAGAGAPTGSVTFMRGTSTLGKATLISGTANFITKPTQLPAGTDQITAIYAGDTNHAGSTSTVFTQTVNKAATSTQVTASPTTITSGQTVTLTATVTPTPSSPPTGTVAFTDGTTNLGSASLRSGSATLVTTGIVGTGTHTIKATYTGTSNYLSSFGTVNVTVQ